MDTLSWIILLAVVGAVLMIGELLLPTHGLLGVAGIVAIAIAIGLCFAINRWVGLGALLVAIVASPFVATTAINLWPKTPVGKRILLPNVESQVTMQPVTVGQTGVAMTELRPMGECEFDGRRLEVISEHGIIPAGSKVRVISVASDKATVRPVTT